MASTLRIWRPWGLLRRPSQVAELNWTRVIHPLPQSFRFHVPGRGDLQSERASCASRFNFNLFFIEVARVLKPRGSLAVWGYGLPECPNNEQITKLIFDFGTSESKMGPYWAPERIHIDERYSNIHPDPRYFDSVRRVEIPCSCQWTIDTVVSSHTRQCRLKTISELR
jgi:hypothetical protein